MKTIFRISFAALATTFMLAGCMEKEMSSPEVAGAKVPFKFCSDEVALKSTYGENYKLCWEDAKDQVGVFIGTSTANAQATISRDGDSKAVFTAEVNAWQAGDLVYGYYPFSASVGTLTEAMLEIPA